MEGVKGRKKEASRFRTYEENSMRKEKALKEKEEMKRRKHVEARSASFIQSDAEFDEQVRYIKALQEKTRARQRIMAQLAMEFFSCLCIQCAWRQRLARNQMFLRVMQRFCVHWAKYHFCYRRPRRQSAYVIYRFFIGRKIMRLFENILHMMRTAKRLVWWYRNRNEIKIARKLLSMYRVRAAVMKRALVFGQTRAQNKLLKKRIHEEHMYDSATLIIKFFRKILQKRRLQLLLAQHFHNQQQALRVRALLESHDAFDETDPTCIERNSNAMNMEGAGDLSRKGQRRGALTQSSAVSRSRGLVNGIGAARQIYNHGLPSITAWNANLKPFAEVILHILSRIRPYVGTSLGHERDTSSIYDYLIRQREDHDERIRLEREEIKKNTPYKARKDLRELLLAEGEAGYGSAEALLPKALTNPPSDTKSRTASKSSVQGTSGNRRAAVSSEKGLTGARENKLPQGRGREASIIKKTTKEKVQGLKENEKNKTAKTEEMEAQKRLDAVNEEGATVRDLYRGGKHLMLPTELMGIFRPKTIVEILDLIFDLKEMVLSMNADAFARVVGKSGKEAALIEPDGTASQDCICRGESVRLGAPSKMATVDYFIFTTTTKLLTTSRAHLRNLQQSHRLQKRAEDLLKGAKALCSGSRWNPHVTDETEREQERRMSVMSVFSKRGHNGVITGIFKAFYENFKVEESKAQRPARLHQRAQQLRKKSTASDTDRKDESNGNTNSIGSPHVPSDRPQAKSETAAPTSKNKANVAEMSTRSARLGAGASVTSSKAIAKPPLTKKGIRPPGRKIAGRGDKPKVAKSEQSSVVEGVNPGLEVVPPFEVKSQPTYNYYRDEEREYAATSEEIGYGSFGPLAAAAEGDRQGGRTRHIVGALPSAWNQEEHEAREACEEDMSKSSSVVAVPVKFTELLSSQYSSEYTKSLLLHMVTDSMQQSEKEQDASGSEKLLSSVEEIPGSDRGEWESKVDVDVDITELRKPEAPSGMPPSTLSTLQQGRAVTFAPSGGSSTTDIHRTAGAVPTSHGNGHDRGMWSERRRRNRNL